MLISPLPAALGPTKSTVGGRREEWTGQPSPLQRQNTEQNLSGLFMKKYIQLDLKNYSSGVACLHRQDHLQCQGQSLHHPRLRSLPLCLRHLRPLAGQSSCPSRSGVETGHRDKSQLYWHCKNTHKKRPFSERRLTTVFFCLAFLNFLIASEVSASSSSPGHKNKWM